MIKQLHENCWVMSLSFSLLNLVHTFLFIECLWFVSTESHQYRSLSRQQNSITKIIFDLKSRPYFKSWTSPYSVHLTGKSLKHHLSGGLNVSMNQNPYLLRYRCSSTLQASEGVQCTGMVTMVSDYWSLNLDCLKTYHNCYVTQCNKIV